MALRYTSTLLISSALLLTACGESSQPTTADSTASDADRYVTTLSMHDLMEDVLEPVADSLWRSAGWIDDVEEGYYELYPTTDEGWEHVRQQAGLIVELGNSLALPGRREDDDAWLTYSRAMSEVGLQAMEAAQRQHEEDIFQAGARLYSVCNACHLAYNPEIGRFFD